MLLRAGFAALLLALAVGLSGADGIPGVFAGGGTVFVQATQQTGNSIAVALDGSGAYLVVTVNGQSVAYAADGVSGLQITGGAGGGDSVSVGALYNSINVAITTCTGNNAISLATGNILTGSTILTLYGDHTAVTASATTKATVYAYGAPHNTYSPSGNFSVQDTSSVPYSPSTIPGVFEVDDEIVIVPQLQHGNVVSVASTSTTGSYVMVTENGQTSASFGTFRPNELLYSTGMGGGDTLTVTAPVSLLVSLYGAPSTVNAGTGVSGFVSLYASGNTFSIASSDSLTLDEFDPGLTTLSENVSGGGSDRVQGEAVAPMLPIAWTGSAGSPDGGPTAPASSSSSSHHCGVGGGTALLLALGGVLAPWRRGRRGAFVGVRGPQRR